MRLASGSPFSIGPAPALGLVKAELFGSDLIVVWVAEVACVVIVVGPAQGERLDVVNHGRERRPPFGEAHFAKPVRPLQPALALALPGSASEAFYHASLTVIASSSTISCSPLCSTQSTSSCIST